MEKDETIPVTGSMCDTEPFLDPLALALLEDIWAFFREQKNEAEYHEWLKDPEKGAPGLGRKEREDRT